MKSLQRILYLPLGLLRKLVDLALEGSRDRYNQIRFPKSVIDAECRINEQTAIEEGCHVFENCLILNSTIRSFTYVGRNSILQNTELGSYCSVANDVCIGLGNHPIDYFTTSPLFYRKNNPLNKAILQKDIGFTEYEPIKIGCDVWIGARAIVLDGVSIGHGAIVAANSVVTKDVPPYAIVGGIPAKTIKYRFTSEKIERLLKSEWWLLSPEEIKPQMTELNSF